MDTNSYRLKPIANKESLTYPDSTMGSGPSFSVASHIIIMGREFNGTETHGQ